MNYKEKLEKIIISQDLEIQDLREENENLKDKIENLEETIRLLQEDQDDYVDNYEDIKLGLL